MDPRRRSRAVSAVVLAAGLSRRFSGPVAKQLLVVEGAPLVRRTALHLVRSAFLREVVVVVGHEADRVRAAVEDLSLRVLENPRFHEGQSTSVKTGLRAVMSQADAVLFVPVDQPGLSTPVVNRLVETYLRTGGPIVRPVCGQRSGAPVLFARRFYPELLTLSGDEGGRQILGRHRDEIVALELDEELPLMDINTREDYERLCALLSSRRES